MKTTITSAKKRAGNPDWEAIINYTKVGIKSAPKPAGRLLVRAENEKKHLMPDSVNIKTVCHKLKKDLEWYCNLPDKNKSKIILRNILDSPVISTEPNAGIIEKWWQQ